jgi:hypothetical protein
MFISVFQRACLGMTILTLCNASYAQSVPDKKAMLSISKAGLKKSILYLNGEDCSLRAPQSESTAMESRITFNLPPQQLVALLLERQDESDPGRAYGAIVSFVTAENGQYEADIEPASDGKGGRITITRLPDKGGKVTRITEPTTTPRRFRFMSNGSGSFCLREGERSN